MKIIHITQLHKPPFGIKARPEVIDSIVQSQFKVACEIKKHSDYPVLVEGLYKTAHDNRSDEESSTFSDVVKMIFPKGFPSDFNEINSLQKEFLYEKGAVCTLFYLGEIKSIYKSIHKNSSIAIDKAISEGEYRQIFAPRELEAIECAKEAALANFHDLDSATVFLVYGSGHDFKPHCDKEKFAYERIDTTTLPTIPFNNNRTTNELEKVVRTDFNRGFQKVTLVKETIFSNKDVIVPNDLQRILNDSWVGDYVKDGYVTLDKLVEIHDRTPHIIGALRCCNIYEGIYNKYIDIDQLSKLTKEQVKSIVHKFADADLQAKIEGYVKMNQKPQESPHF